MTMKSQPDELLIGLVSISDRAANGIYEDKGIPALSEWFTAALKSPWRIETRLISDDRALIEKTLIELTDDCHCDLVLTTGGTGPARRDVTPDEPSGPTKIDQANARRIEGSEWHADRARHLRRRALLY